MYSVNTRGFRGPLGTACTPQYLDYQCVSCCPGQPTTTATPAQPVAQDPRQVCESLFQMWIGQNPQYAACMTRDDRDAIVNQCIAWKTNRATLADVEKKRTEILERACGATFKTACEKAYAAWAAGNPQLAACVTPAGKNRLMKVCIQGQQENWPQQRRTEAWNAKVSVVAVCPVPVAVPPAPVATPVQSAPPPAPPPAPTVYVEPPSVTMMDESGMYTEPEPPPAPAPSAFRKWGPILGIGLVIAAGTYYVGRSPKKKRGSQRSTRRAAA